MTEPKKVLCIGECMLEFSSLTDGKFKRSFAGDTYNTAVYFKRLFGDALTVSYWTALGDDPLSDLMIEQMKSEGIQTAQIQRVHGGAPGLYLIENDEAGERFFQYWRSASAARQMLRGVDAAEFAKVCREYDLIYLSGITLAILDGEQRQTLLGALAQAKGELLFAFDPNFRSKLWSDIEVCKDVMLQVASLSDIVLTTMEDEWELWGIRDAKAALMRWKECGVTEVVIKDGGHGCWIDQGNGTIDLQNVKPERKLSPIDTTGAGDSFASGYLGERLLGKIVEEAARTGNRIASKVVMLQGAVIDEPHNNIAF